MSRVITFSRVFPATHPRKGQATYFVEKIQNSLITLGLPMFDKTTSIDFIKTLSLDYFHSKHHTIRAGNRWEAGDWFSPRVWSGKPYASKQITIAPDIYIKKVWTIKMNLMSRPHFIINGKSRDTDFLNVFAQNDGLTLDELKEWLCCGQSIINSGFFEGQIICWNENIQY